MQTSSCPNCGYCLHCGRGPQQQYPNYPYNQGGIAGPTLSNVPYITNTIPCTNTIPTGNVGTNNVTGSTTN